MKFKIETLKPVEIMMRMKEFETDVLRKSNGLVSASSKKSKGCILLTIITPMDNSMFETIFRNEISVALKTIDKKVKVTVVKD